jgi:hypothetical protein
MQIKMILYGRKDTESTNRAATSAIASESALNLERYHLARLAALSVEWIFTLGVSVDEAIEILRLGTKMLEDAGQDVNVHAVDTKPMSRSSVQ